MNLRIVMRPWCWIVGHRRGAFLRVILTNGVHDFNAYACPRCLRQTKYKVRPK
jgi:hypothetical protein